MNASAIKERYFKKRDILKVPFEETLTYHEILITRVFIRFLNYVVA